MNGGATIVLVALSLVFLMGMTAVAVDSGILFNDRRQQQSGADVGALAASQFAKTTLISGNAICNAEVDEDFAACRGAEEALDVIDGTLPGRYSAADWLGCADASMPAEFTQVSFLSPCINYTDNLQKVRVVLSGTDVDTAFARVIGFDSVRIGALAEAGVDLNISADVLPFAIGPSGAGGTQACFVANASVNLDIVPCDSGNSGNYGKLDIRTYGNSTLGTSEICTGSQQQRMETNINLGADHPLEVTGSSPGIDNDVANCPTFTNPVDEVQTWTGNSAGALKAGLFNGIGSPAFEGRLACKAPISTDTGGENPARGFVSNECADVNNNLAEDIDHTPLWDFVVPGANAEVVGGACAPGGGVITDRAEMDACLAGWNAWPGAHTISLFDQALTKSARFAAVPILNADPSGGAGNYLITDFRPVYIETTYMGCTGFSCSVVHSPGEDDDATPPASCPNPLTAADTSCGWLSNGNKNIAAVSAFMMTMDMLDPITAATFPFTPGTIVFNLSK